MTKEEWESSNLASELNLIINNPAFTKALEVLETYSALEVVDPNTLLDNEKAGQMFAFESGRKSVIRDLQFLAQPNSEETKVEATYGNN